jgi:hypothetical protein
MVPRPKGEGERSLEASKFSSLGKTQRAFESSSPYPYRSFLITEKNRLPPSDLLADLNQFFFDQAISLNGLIILDGDVEGLVGTDDHTQLFGTGQRRVKEIPLKQNIMLSQEGHDHGLIFTALRFMDRDGIGEGDVIELIFFITHGSPIKINSNPVFLFVNIDDKANVTVEDFFLVVIADLHDFIVELYLPTSNFETFVVGIQPLLEFAIEIIHSHHTLVHGADHLNLRRERAHIQSSRNAENAKIDDGLENFVLIF